MMRNFQAPTAAEDVAGSHYGPHGDAYGIVSDHLRLIAEAPRVFPSGRQMVVSAAGRVIPVLCSELIEVATEDGPAAGRCGAPVYGDDDACPGHQADIARYRSLSDSERWAEEVAAERL